MPNINAPIYRVYLTHITAGSHEAFPYGFEGHEINAEREKINNDDSVFIRRFLDGDFLFKNRAVKGVTDFDWILAIENGVNACSKIEVEVKRSCDGGNTYEVFWLGSFTTADGKFDLDMCEFKTQLQVEDIYQCIFDGADNPYNIIQIPNEYTVVDTGATFSYEYQCCVFNGVTGDGICPNPMVDPEWIEMYVDITNPGAVQFVWFREYMWTNCIAGIPYPPAGAGWVLDTDDCATTGTAKYVRVPAIGQPPSSEFTVLTDAACDTPPGGAVENVCEHDYNGIHYCFFWERSPTAIINYTHTRGIPETLLAVAQNACSDIFGICSDFLSINPAGDAPGYVAGQNYVTGDIQKLDQLFISAKSDILLPTATQPATIANITLNELLNQMHSMFDYRWWITRSVIPNQNVLRIEHISYFQYGVQENLTVAPYAQMLNGSNQYERIKAKRPYREIYKWMEAKSPDFVGADIVYNFDCVYPMTGRGGIVQGELNKNEVTYSASRITTDIPYITTNPADISPDGFVIMATVLTSGNYFMINEPGLITGNVIQNGHLSWANLHYNYHRHNRVLLQGSMNNAPETFFSAKTTKEQKDIFISDCCDGIDDDVIATEIIGTFTTAMGNGLMSGYKKNLKDDVITLKLEY